MNKKISLTRETYTENDNENHVQFHDPVQSETIRQLPETVGLVSFHTKVQAETLSDLPKSVIYVVFHTQVQA